MTNPVLTPPTEQTPAVQRVADALAAAGHPHTPVMLSDAARTAQQAADALGVALGQIAKSIVFRRKNHPSGGDAAVLVITSGDRRVDEKKVQAIVCADGGKLGRADAEFVKTKTGFSIGGVSPLAHATPPVTLIDRELLRFPEIWAAAGHPHGVFRLTPTELQALTGAPLHDVTEIGGLVDQHKAPGDQSVDAALGNAIDLPLQQCTLVSPVVVSGLGPRAMLQKGWRGVSTDRNL